MYTMSHFAQTSVALAWMLRGMLEIATLQWKAQTGLGAVVLSGTTPTKLVRPAVGGVITTTGLVFTISGGAKDEGNSQMSTVPTRGGVQNRHV